MVGLAGTTDLGATGEALLGAPDGVVLVARRSSSSASPFKGSVFRFHFWVPDTYEGAPTAVGAYLSVTPKAGALLALARIMPEALPDGHLGWPIAIGIVAAAMILQRNAVRLLAFSSISQ